MWVVYSSLYLNHIKADWWPNSTSLPHINIWHVKVLSFRLATNEQVAQLVREVEYRPPIDKLRQPVVW